MAITRKGISNLVELKLNQEPLPPNYKQDVFNYLALKVKMFNTLSGMPELWQLKSFLSCFENARDMLDCPVNSLNNIYEGIKIIVESFEIEWKSLKEEMRKAFIS